MIQISLSIAGVVVEDLNYFSLNRVQVVSFTRKRRIFKKNVQIC